MAKVRKPPPANSKPSLRDKLTAAFVQNIEADWAQHGTSVIEKLREKYPERYADIVARLTAPAEPPPGPGDYSQCHDILALGRKMLLDNGMPEAALTDQAIEQAAEALDALKDRFDEIMKGH